MRKISGAPTSVSLISINNFVFILGAQYAWLKEDLSKVDRAVTPWLVATMHPPWYNSYSSHYQEFECMRQEMEELLYQHRVDIVFAGHVSSLISCSYLANACLKLSHIVI